MSDDTQPSSSSVYEVLVMILEQIASVSWQKLGLQADIITRKTEVDLPQAKVAIDVAAFIANKIEGELDESDRKTVQNLVTSLRLNYVQKSRDAEN